MYTHTKLARVIHIRKAEPRPPPLPFCHLVSHSHCVSFPLRRTNPGHNRRTILSSLFKMAEVEEYRCFVGGLSWSTSDRKLKDSFEKFGNLLEARVAVDKFSGRSRGFGFVTFDDHKAMEDAIKAMNGMDLDGRTITVDKAKPQQGSARDDGDRYRENGRDRNHRRDYGGGRSSNSGECFKCGKPGHFARECPEEEGRGGRYGDRESRYGSSGGGGRYGPDRNADRYSGGRNRDADRHGDYGNDRYNRSDRAGPYERRGTGGSRSG